MDDARIPPEPHLKPIGQLIAARQKLINAIEREGQISLDEAVSIAEAEDVSLEYLLARLPSECQVDWKRKVIRCR